jgi:hypothetical protein
LDEVYFHRLPVAGFGGESSPPVPGHWLVVIIYFYCWLYLERGENISPPVFAKQAVKIEVVKILCAVVKISV